LWVGDAGTAATFYILKEWASITARQKGIESFFMDPETHPYMKSTGEMISKAQIFICKKSPADEWKPINPKAPIVIDKMIPKKFGMFVGAKLIEMYRGFGQDPSLGDFSYLGMLFPIMHDERCFFSFFQINEGKLDEAYNVYVKYMHDSKNWATMSEMEDGCINQMSILASPIDFSKLPKV